MERPITTLFMLMSVDGKISTGATDELDVDKDFPKIAGVSEGLHQYYEIEQTTDLWSLNTGRVQEKMGVNTKPLPNKTPVSFVLIDNKHLSEHGVRYFCALSKEFVLITTNVLFTQPLVFRKAICTSFTKNNYHYQIHLQNSKQSLVARELPYKVVVH